MALMLYEANYAVHTFQADIHDKIRPAAILDFFQDVASINAEQLGVGYHDVLALNLYWVVLYEEFEILKDVNWGDRVLVRTWPKSRNRLEFEREYELRSLDNELLCKGISSWCVIDTKTRKLERGENVIFKGEYYDYTNYPEKINRRLKFEIDNPDRVYDYRVLLTDLDHNLHVNNAKYLDILYNMHATKKSVKKCRIAFMNEAKLNEIIHIEYKKENNQNYYIGYVNDVVCFMEILDTEE